MFGEEAMAGHKGSKGITNYMYNNNNGDIDDLT
jgi:hypothetical protein